MNLFVEFRPTARFLNLNPGNPSDRFSYLRPNGSIDKHSNSWEDYVTDIRCSATTHIWTEASTWAEFYELHPEYFI